MRSYWKHFNKSYKFYHTSKVLHFWYMSSGHLVGYIRIEVIAFYFRLHYYLYPYFCYIRVVSSDLEALRLSYISFW